MKTKSIFIITLWFILHSFDVHAQSVWSDQLCPPEEGSTTVSSSSTVLNMDVCAIDSDVDIDSVVDNFYTSFMEAGIDWISLTGYTVMSSTDYTLSFSIQENRGLSRSVSLGTESNCYELFQNAYGPLHNVDWDRNWKVNISYNTMEPNIEQPVCDISYYDGLGYESQFIQMGASTQGHSVITPHSFDAFHREAVRWLPFPYATEGEAIDDVFSEQSCWYGERYGEDESSCSFYSDFMEAAPSGRSTGSSFPGNDMIDASSDHIYRANTAADSLLRYSANQFTGVLTCSGYYAPGTLRADEYTDSDGHTVVTWTDSGGRTVRIDGRASSAQRTSTEYVYDARGNLCWMIFPEGSAIVERACSTALASGQDYHCQAASDLAREWCFVYKRDSRNRITGKHIPGKGWESYAYDALDRVASSSDSLQRSRGQSIHYEYDALGRETSRYVVFEAGADSCCLIDTRYDSYSGLISPVVDSVYVQGAAIQYPKGLKTEEVVRLIDDTLSFGQECLIRRYWYDSAERVVQSLEEFPDSSCLRTSYRYGIQGNVLKMMQTYSRGSETSWLLTAFLYDGRCRLSTMKRTINGIALDDITYGYDELGRMVTKSCGSKLSENQTYDVRGWKDDFNVYRGSDKLFGERLRYSVPVKSQSVAAFNGNISEITSSQYGRNSETMSYFYDGMNRLYDTRHYTGSQGSPDNKYTERDIVYDRNGNIQSLTRSQEASQSIAMSYEGNRLVSYGTSDSFEYDSGGNCTYDPVTGLEYSWNLLNLPCDVCRDDGMEFHYTYFADGTKYSVMSEEGDGRTYAGPFVYAGMEGGDYEFESIAWDEGRITYDADAEEYCDLWFVKDHIGSIREVVDIRQNTTATMASVLVEQNAYLPLGTKISLPSFSTSANRYRLGGKEEQRFGSLTTNLVDFGARSYNPTICRWMSVDPLAEKYSAVSPYVYCGNNPINLVDPNGEDIYLLFNGRFNELLIFQDNNTSGNYYDDELIGVFAAHNKVAPKSKGMWEDGTYEMLDKTHRHTHGGSVTDGIPDDSSNGKYGEGGCYRAMPFYESNGTKREGMAVHAGRAYKPFEERVTFGCVRTTDDAMEAIDAGILEYGKLRLIKIINNKPILP